VTSDWWLLHHRTAKKAAQSENLKVQKEETGRERDYTTQTCSEQRQSMLGLFSLRETCGAATGAPTKPADRAADPSVLVSRAAPQEAAQLQPPAASRRASSARANRPKWAFQAGARRSGGADGGAQHGNSCVCCTRPQVRPPPRCLHP